VTATDRRAETRPLQPPYLLTAGTDHRGVVMGVIADASTAVVELTVHGSWSEQLGRQVTAGLRLCLAGPSAAIIIDLHELGDRHGVSQPFWLAAEREARLGSTPVQIALCAPSSTRLDYRLRNLDAAQPPVFATMPEARMTIAGRLSRTQRVQARLAPRPSSVRAARDLVTRACQVWRLSELHRDAALVISELATNAVEHAGTDFVVTASTDSRRLHLAVRDSATHYPHLNKPSNDRQAASNKRGRGLWIVHQATTAWGAMPTRGGKVVWATVSPASDSYRHT